jgi:hypothetical protein
MRFTFVILLFCCLGADAQMIIKAHANYRPLAQPVVNLLLDDYPNAAAAYSLRKLDKDYTGNAIRVRRSNDNTEQNIGFTSGGDLDTASLKTFVGANSGFVTTWYDQSGNSRNATQSTAANQPRIVNAGTVDRENNKPFIRFDGTNDFMNHEAQLFATTKVHDIFLTGNNRDNTGTQIIYEQSANYNVVNGAYVLYADASKTEIAQKIQVTPVNNNNVRSASRAYTSFQIGNFLINRDVNDSTLQGRFFANNSEISMSFVSTFNYNIFNLNVSQNVAYLGARSGGIAPAKLNAYEFIIYTSNQSSNRSGINTNINTYYSIY